jgi:rubrerythrin
MADPHEPGARGPGERPIISEREKPALDETTFQQLLEAAHVLQEQKVFEVANRPGPDPAEALAAIVEAQEFLRSQPIDLQVAAKVVVERLQKITHATGVAVAVVRENRLEYCAATGDAAGLAGTSLAMDSILSSDGQLSTEFTQGHADKLSIALPLQHEGNLSGLLEVRFADVESIPPPEMRSCQLMAGLMTEAIARVADKQWRETLAAERAAMLEALERIKPQLERLAVEPAKDTAQPAREIRESAERVVPAEASKEDRVRAPISESSAKLGREAVCPQCGYQFGERELFCGRCGTPRPARVSPSGDLQSKWASMWHLQQTAANNQHEEEEDESESSETVAAEMAEAGVSPELATGTLSPDLKEMVEPLPHESDQAETAPESDSALVISSETAEEAVPVSLAVREPAKSPWASASRAHEWLESLHPKSAGGIWLANHRADLYVGAAVLLLLIVLSGWGMRPAESRVAVKPAQPNLTFFEKLLVGLGLAETPPVPVYLGNPNAQVWVDLHTALYYCSNSELYGKTPGGKFTTQRDAQLDQFEPAARRNCD